MQLPKNPAEFSATTPEQWAEIVQNFDVLKLDRPIVAAVTSAPFVPYFQVTIDPAEISPCRTFIRFGNTVGDELVGWRPIAGLALHSVLAVYADGEAVPKERGRVGAGVPSAQ